MLYSLSENMWLLKAKLSGKKFLLGSIAVRFNVDLTGYSLAHYKEGKWLYVTMIGFLFGKEQDKKALIKYFKKSEYVRYFEANGDFIIGCIRQPKALELIYDPRIIRTKPSILSHDGYILWELASWDKALLMRVFEFIKKYHGGQLLQLRKQAINNITVAGILPKVTKKQKEALRLAPRLSIQENAR